MTYEEFKQDVTDRIRDFLPEKYADAEIGIHPVVKNNDLKLDGLTIQLADSNIAPNIYLNQYFAEHEEGRPVNDILSEIAEIRMKHEAVHDFDVQKLTDYESVKDKITCRLINAENNGEYLKDKPHTMVQDLSVTYHISIGTSENGFMSAPITNSLMERYGISTEQLHQTAIENMDTLAPASFKSMADTMADLMLPDMMGSGMSAEDARKAIKSMIPPEQDEIMFVLSNKDKHHGASAVLNPKVMDEIAEKVGKDFFILPSSVHEVLIVTGTGQNDLKALESMVQDVNATQVSPAERLSDHVYAYDAETHEIYRADKAAERDKAKTMEKSKTAEHADKKQERTSLKAKLVQKKDIIAKADASRLPNQMGKSRSGHALA